MIHAVTVQLGLFTKNEAGTGFAGWLDNATGGPRRAKIEGGKLIMESLTADFIIGTAVQRTTAKGVPYVAVEYNDPSFLQPVKAQLYYNKDLKAYQLLWKGHHAFTNPPVTP